MKPSEEAGPARGRRSRVDRAFGWDLDTPLAMGGRDRQEGGAHAEEAGPRERD